MGNKKPKVDIKDVKSGTVWYAECDEDKWLVKVKRVTSEGDVEDFGAIAWDKDRGEGIIYHGEGDWGVIGDLMRPATCEEIKLLEEQLKRKKARYFKQQFPVVSKITDDYELF